jgi:Dolichyl-phosphate-mannose-protein mannosyltransferase
MAPVLLLVVVLVLAALARTPKLTVSLWLDEGMSLAAAKHLSSFDAQRPLYFLLLRAWTHVTHSEIGLRLPSVLFGLGWIGVCFSIARRLGGTSLAVLSALFAALSTSQAFHAQEVRMYSLAPLLLWGSALCYLWWIEGGQPRWLVAHAVFGFAAVLTFTPTVLGLAGMWGLAVLARASKRVVVGTIATALVIGVAWLPFAFLAVTEVEGTAWIRRPTYGLLVYLQGWAFVGDSLYLWLPGALSPWAVRGLSVLVVGLAVYGAIGTFWKWPAIWYFSIIAFLFGVSITVRPVWHSRYLTPFMPALFMVTAAGIVKLWTKNRVVASGVAASILLLQVGSVIADTGPLEDWRSAAKLVNGAAANDSVLVTCSSDTVAWSYYYHGSPSTGCAEESTLDAWFTRLKTTMEDAKPSPSSLWLVLRTSSSLTLDEQASLRSRLGHYFQVERFSYTGIEVIRVSRNGI